MLWLRPVCLPQPSSSTEIGLLGMQGFTDVATTLEKVSEAKSQIDEVKGMTLQEISKTVEEINTSINERKVRLAPQIKKLRVVRQQFAVSNGMVQEAWYTEGNHAETCYVHKCTMMASMWG